MNSKQVKNRSVLDKRRFGEPTKAGDGEGCVEGGEGREGPQGEIQREATMQQPRGTGNVDPEEAQCTVGVSHHKPGLGLRMKWESADGLKRGGTERASILKAK